MSLEQYLNGLKFPVGDNRVTHRIQLINALRSTTVASDPSITRYDNYLRTMLASANVSDTERNHRLRQLHDRLTKKSGETLNSRSSLPLLVLQSTLSVVQLMKLRSMSMNGSLLRTHGQYGQTFVKGKMGTKTHDMTIKEAYNEAKKKLPTVARILMDQTDLPDYVDSLQSSGPGGKLSGKTATQIDFSAVEKMESASELKKCILQVREQLASSKRQSFDRVVSFILMNLQRRKMGQLQLNEEVANCIASYGLLNALRPTMFANPSCVEALSKFLR